MPRPSLRNRSRSEIRPGGGAGARLGALALVGALSAAALPAADTIATIAGGSVGDGGPAAQALVFNPLGLACDAAGNLYICEEGHHRIRRIDTAGTITTVAGMGMEGFAGDGGPAASAQVFAPKGITVDAAGNVFFTDSDTYANLVFASATPRTSLIRRIDAASGRISTVAGSGAGFSGDGGPASAAQFSQPVGIAFDAAGNLHVADMLNNRVRRIDRASGIVTTVAGSGEANISTNGGPATAVPIWNPSGVAFNRAGELIIADNVGRRVRKVDATGTIITVAGAWPDSRGEYADGYPATESYLNHPTGVMVEASGQLLIADPFDYRVRTVDPLTGLMGTRVGTGGSRSTGDGGPATAAGTGEVYGMAVNPGGDLFISEYNSGCVRRIAAATGTITTVCGTFAPIDGVPALHASLRNPAGVVQDAAGDLFICDTYNESIRKIDAVTGVMSIIAGLPPFAGPGGYGDGGPAAQAAFSRPMAIALDSAENLYIAEYDNSRIRRIDAVTGTITTVVGGNNAQLFIGDGGPATLANLHNPLDIAIDAHDVLYIADAGNNCVRRVALNEGIITTIAGHGSAQPAGGFGGDGGPAVAALLNRPSGLALDGHGNLYVADSGNARVRVIDAGGAIRTLAGDGTDAVLSHPGKLAVLRDGRLIVSEGDTIGAGHPGDGDLYAVDTASGAVSVLAGLGVDGYNGESGAALAVQLYRPSGLFAARDGSLLVADSWNDRIRRIPPRGQPVGTDIGTARPGLGGVGGDSTAFTVAAGGTGIAGTADDFRFVPGSLPGDGEFSARVTLAATQAGAKAGLMLRESDAPGARNVFLALNPQSGLVLQWRSQTGGPTQVQAAAAGATGPLWLRLVRHGDSVAASWSQDAVTWTAAGQVLVQLPRPAEAGAAVTGASATVAATGTFTGLTTTPYAPGQPLSVASAFGAALAGSGAETNGGLTTVAGGGTLIGDTATDGGELLASAPLPGDFDFLAQVQYQRATDGNAQAGLMLRAGTAPDAPNLFLFLTPSHGGKLQRRSVAGGPTALLARTNNTAHWYRITRTGGQVATFWSLDGTAWQPLASTALTGPLSVGLATCSANPALLGVATFANVALTSSDPAPQVTVTTPVAATNAVLIPFTLTFSAPVTGLTSSALIVGNGSAGLLTGSGALYTVAVTPAADGPVTVTVPAHAAVSSVGLGNLAGAGAATSDRTAPVATITPSGVTTHTSPIVFTIAFSEPVTGLTASGAIASQGSITALIDSGTHDRYTALVTPTANTTVYLSLYAGAAHDAAGNICGATYASVISDIPTAPPLPAAVDIGTARPGLGGVSGDSTAFTVAAGGTGIAGTADDFRFVPGSLPGDGEFSARVTLAATQAGAKAGLMLRESDAPGARNVLLALNRQSGLVLQWRSQADGPTQVQVAAAGATGPLWLRLARHGDSVAASWS